jgi:hypothetical protein
MNVSDEQFAKQIMEALAQLNARIDELSLRFDRLSMALEAMTNRHDTHSLKIG